MRGRTRPRPTAALSTGTSLHPRVAKNGRSPCPVEKWHKTNKALILELGIQCNLARNVPTLLGSQPAGTVTRHNQRKVKRMQDIHCHVHISYQAPAQPRTVGEEEKSSQTRRGKQILVGGYTSRSAGRLLAAPVPNRSFDVEKPWPSRDVRISGVCAQRQSGCERKQRILLRLECYRATFPPSSQVGIGQT